ncbi:glycosyltransferase [Pelagicoccus enzymogenes]|uniref:CgeB family protein n=1 Tax=Pelagicoccus enzymogenes TaxID=2773457 RepID=UPI00280DD0D4|nr:glycosyltransferase [Pelagicoccus enzymogenes]MDQ8199778.1 glycosyltransferase [Pelagicoccus enzymogenes]
MKKFKNILYVGPLTNGSTCKHRCESLVKLGHSIKTIDYGKHNYHWLLRLTPPPLLKRISPLIDPNYINRRIKNTALRTKPDILWIDKIIHLKKSTLIKIQEACRTTICTFYSPDDMFNRQNSSIVFRKAIPHYDKIITTKSYNVNEYYNSGARHVIFTNNAYSESTHKPTSQPPNGDRYDISFIGAQEDDRHNKIVELANNLPNRQIHIWGMWKWNTNKPSNIVMHEKFLADSDYARMISASKINLCFLRKVNRDLQTTRTMEIPACGGFMLAERTDEHSSLFTEGEEAEFFSSTNELIEKAKHYLQDEETRHQISIRARERCLSSGYSNKETMARLISQICEE